MVTMTPELDRLARTIVACRKCPRLVRYRERIARTKKREFMHDEYWGRPLPGFGDPTAELLILGLAPAAHGGNRTGRMFTGDSSGQWLMRALYRAGFASQPTSEHRDDGLELRNAFITATVRCAPPDNTPTAQEMANCSGYLDQELALLRHARVMVALGQIAFVTYLHLAAEHGVTLPRPRPAFKHGAVYHFQTKPPIPPLVIASYHPSRQNTQTGRLTEVMLDHVFRRARQLLQRDGPGA